MIAGTNDFYQQARLGIATVGNDSSFTGEMLSNILQFVRTIPQIEIIDSGQDCFSEPA